MPESGTDHLVVALAGDVMLGRLVNETMQTRGFAHPWGDIVPVIKESDAFLVNLECALTSHLQHWTDGEEKALYFRANPAVVQTLQIADVDFVSLANNHAGDFEMEGLLETVRVLDHAGIAHAGAGSTLAEAEQPAVLTVAGQRICVLSFADYPVAWAATPTRPGINYTKISTHPEPFGRIQGSLTAAREIADLVIFSIHWGPNMVSHPSKEFQEFAHAVIDAGADVFWGHSAHIVQGVEIWNGKLILYDTGDFVDDYAVDQNLRNDLSALFRLHLRPPVIEHVEVIPTQISDMQVNLSQGADREWFVQRFQGLCRKMGTYIDVSDSRVTIKAHKAHATAGTG